MSALASVRHGALLGARDARTRMASRPAIAVLLASVAFALVVGMLERRSAGAGAVDRALGAVFNLAVPLASFALFALTTGRRRLDDAIWPVARFGADRRSVALGAVGASALAAAGVSALAAVIAVVCAHGSSSAPLASDAATSAWIAALTACSYVGWFAVGATFFRLGGGRIAILVLDFIVGDVGALASIMPRGLSQNLIGITAADLSQRGASGVLAATAVTLAVVAALRCGR